MNATRLTGELARLIIGELLLTEQRHLPNIPSCGRGLFLADDVVLRWSDGNVYRIVQGSWTEIPAESIPIEIYLPHLRLALERRRELINKRIARLVDNLATIESIEKVAHPLSLGGLLIALSDAKNSR